MKGHVVGNDIGAGFDQDWVEMLKINEVVAAKGTAEKLEEVIEGFKKGKIQVLREII